MGGLERQLSSAWRGDIWLVVEPVMPISKPTAKNPVISRAAGRRGAAVPRDNPS
jgi:hypothetical protein